MNSGEREMSMLERDGMSNELVDGRCTDADAYPRRAVYYWLRGLVERTIVALLLVSIAPLIALLAVLVKITSPGPALYSQTRLGRHGRPFQIYKLRTMIHNCEAFTGPVWSCAQDHRVTPLGRILRDTHLDELPQLWNVLRGEMSLIGPRPERPEIARRLESTFPGFYQRLAIKPGLTGLAQLRLPADTDIAGVPHKLSHDLHYIRNLGPILDLRIVVATACHVVAKGCGSAIRLMLAMNVEADRQLPVAIERERQSAEMENVELVAA